MTFHSQRFDRAASTYGAHARVQADMAETLIDLLSVGSAGSTGVTGSLEPMGPVLEMGCGTGLFTRKLLGRFPVAEMVVTDAAPRMLTTARSEAGQAAVETQRVAWELFDASGEAAVPEPVARVAPYALAASAAMVQWFPRLESHFRMVGSLLAPGGAYLVSGFTRENFPELNAILAGSPFAYPDYPGHEAEGIRASAAAAGFAVEAFREDSLETTVPSARAFLESIRGLGSARRPESGRPMTRARLAFLLDRYEERYSCGIEGGIEGGNESGNKTGIGGGEGGRNGGGSGVRATWKPWYALLRKPPKG